LVAEHQRSGARARYDVFESAEVDPMHFGLRAVSTVRSYFLSLHL
jgi:hypothetical protein